MNGVIRVSKPGKPETGVKPLDNGRWAYVVDGLVRFVRYTEEECRRDAAIVASKAEASDRPRERS